MQEILYTLFGIDEVLNKDNADKLYEVIDSKLKTKEFLPQALFNQFKIEVLATTDATADDLKTHKAISGLGLNGRVIPTFRPDDVSDPLRADFSTAIDKLSAVSGVALLITQPDLQKLYFLKLPLDQYVHVVTGLDTASSPHITHALVAAHLHHLLNTDHLTFASNQSKASSCICAVKECNTGYVLPL